MLPTSTSKITTSPDHFYKDYPAGRIISAEAVPGADFAGHSGCFDRWNHWGCCRWPAGRDDLLSVGTPVAVVPCRVVFYDARFRCCRGAGTGGPSSVCSPAAARSSAACPVLDFWNAVVHIPR